MNYKTWEGEVPFFIQTQEAIDLWKEKYGASPSDYMVKYFADLAPGTEMCRTTIYYGDSGETEVLKTHVGGKTEMRRVEPFQATLIYHDWYQGRSKVGVIWRDAATGILYPMAMQCLDACLRGKPYILAGKALDNGWRVVRLPGGYFSLAASEDA